MKFEGSLPKFELDYAKLAAGKFWPEGYVFEAEEYAITDLDGFLKGNPHVIN